MATATSRPWDPTFTRWIETAQAEGTDPNDVGDREWNDPTTHVREHYLPHIRPTSRVLELGPGTGRITRHVIGQCSHMVLVDFSQFACQWLNNYLKGRGSFQTYRIDKPAMPEVADASVDFVFAFGVFEHIGLDDLRWFLEEFDRVLASDGRVIFNFDNIMTAEGLEWHQRWRQTPGHHNVFRFYHPDTVAWLARAAGFEVAALRTDETRHAEIELVKAEIALRPPRPARSGP